MPLFKNFKNISLCLIEFHYGQKKPGVAEGPRYLVKSGLKTILTELNYTINSESIASYDGDPNSTSLQKCGSICQQISKRVHEESMKNNFCLNIGGDHSIATGTIAGMLATYPDLCVLWIDAHTDINRVDTSPSGNVHGMPTSLILDDPRQKAKDAFPIEYKWCQKNKTLQPSRLAFIGIRQMDQGEIETVQDLNICTYDMLTIDKLGISECISTALHKIDPTGTRPIHVSFDIDSLDPSLIPCTGTKVPGGLTIREILFVAEAVYKTGRFAGMDIVEYNPQLASTPEDVSKTEENIFTALKAFFGDLRPTFS